MISPYHTNKQARLPWVEHVPERWEVRRLRTVAEMRVSNVDKHANDDELPVRLCNYVDVYKNDRITHEIPFMRATASSEEIERFRLERGDVLITKDSETWDDIGVSALVTNSADDLICGYHLALLRPQDQILGTYLAWALRPKPITYQFHVEAKGVTRFGLTHDGIQSIRIPVPPISEQATIVRFLDHADEQIQRYIAGKERLITLLEEERQALVHQAVTQGLDPNVKLKPSGVEWLGEVPEHWEMRPLKRWVSTKITDGPHETPTFLDDGVPFMSAESMVGGRLDFSRSRGAISREQHEAYCRKCHPQRDDIFMCKSGATTGKVAIVETDAEFSVWSPLALIRVDLQKVLARLLFDVLQTSYVQQQIRDIWSYGTQPNLSMSAMERLVVVLPPIDEQREMVTYLDHTTKRLSEVIDHTQREIDLMEEYRTRLIADVVTGKLDVRAAAEGLSDPKNGDRPAEHKSLSSNPTINVTL